MRELTVSRYLALAFALGLAVIEASLNMGRPSWQYAPLWIIDYVIVGALLGSFWLTRRPGHEPALMASWALAAGVFYMALFVSLDPDLKWGAEGPDRTILKAMGLGLLVQVVGLVLAALAYYRRRRS
jgi:hypothetical protein